MSAKAACAMHNRCIGPTRGSGRRARGAARWRSTWRDVMHMPTCDKADLSCLWLKVGHCFCLTCLTCMAPKTDPLPTSRTARLEPWLID